MAQGIGTEPHISRNRDLVAISVFFLSSRILFLLFWLINVFAFNTEYEYGSVFLQYDGIHYLNIGLNGYQQDYEYAFFPLFPMIVRFFSLFGIPIAGPVILNHLLTLGTAVLLYFTLRTETSEGRRAGMYGAVLYLFSPIAIATCVLYTEALFLLLTISSFYCILHKKNFVGGVLTGLAILTRSLGAMFFIAVILISAYRCLRKKEGLSWLEIFRFGLPASVIGGLYPLYLQVKLGNWHYFVDVQYGYWNRVGSNMFSVIRQDFSRLDENLITVLFTYSALAVCIWIGYNAFRAGGNPILIVYLLLTILAVFSTAREEGAASISFYRYLFGCSSLFLLSGDVKGKLPLLIVCVIMTMITMLVYCAGGFLI